MGIIGFPSVDQSRVFSASPRVYAVAESGFSFDNHGCVFQLNASEDGMATLHIDRPGRSRSDSWRCTEKAPLLIESRKALNFQQFQSVELQLRYKSYRINIHYQRILFQKTLLCILINSSRTPECTRRVLIFASSLIAYSPQAGRLGTNTISHTPTKVLESTDLVA